MPIKPTMPEPYKECLAGCADKDQQDYVDCMQQCRVSVKGSTECLVDFGTNIYLYDGQGGDACQGADTRFGNLCSMPMIWVMGNNMKQSSCVSSNYWLNTNTMDTGEIYVTQSLGGYGTQYCYWGDGLFGDCAKLKEIPSNPGNKSPSPNSSSYHITRHLNEH